MFPTAVNGQLPFGSSKVINKSKTKQQQLPVTSTRQRKVATVAQPVTHKNSLVVIKSQKVETQKSSNPSNSHCSADDVLYSKGSKRIKRMSIQEIVRKIFKIPSRSKPPEKKLLRAQTAAIIESGNSSVKQEKMSYKKNVSVKRNSLELFSEQPLVRSQFDQLKLAPGSKPLRRSKSSHSSVSRIPRLQSICEEDEPVMPMSNSSYCRGKLRRTSSDHFDRETLLRQLGLYESDEWTKSSDDIDNDDDDSSTKR